MGINFPEPANSGVFVTGLILSVIFYRLSSRCSFSHMKCFFYSFRMLLKQNVCRAAFPPDSVHTNVLHLFVVSNGNETNQEPECGTPS